MIVTSISTNFSDEYCRTGSGKTTLLQHILTSKEHSYKVAVIVNDMAELNIDGQAIERLSSSDPQSKNAIVKTRKEVVKLENGCICCTLRGDLIREINRIQKEADFDYVLIESTGIAEPQQVAESFCVDPETLELAGSDDSMLWNVARLDTCVTVVDAVNFADYLSSLKRFQDIFQDGLDDAEEGEGKKSISELMVEQVEFANVIIVNKVDLVSKRKLETTQKLIQALNPKAKVITGSYGKVDLKQILNTSLFNMQEASESPGWLVSLQDGGGAINASHGEADEYGVSSFVFRSRKPFHPDRLNTFLTDDLGLCFSQEWNSSTFNEKQSITNHKKVDTSTKKTYGIILRSKGSCWIAGRDAHEIGWAHTGRIIQLSPTSAWYCQVHPKEWQGVEIKGEPDKIENLFFATKEDADRMENLFFATKEDGTRGEKLEYGDRRQELVFIGTDLNALAITSRLEWCLLSESEMLEYTPESPPGYYMDPLVPFAIPCDEAKTVSVIVRHNQNQHFQIFPGFALTLNHLSLNEPERNQKEALPIRAVKVWLDQPDTVRRGMLLATLRPEKFEQHAMSLRLLPRDNAVSSYRIRIELSMINCTSDSEKREACDVHIMGTVEPLPYAAEGDGSDEEEDHSDHDH